MDVPLVALDLPAGLRGAAREQVARRQLPDRFGLPANEIQMRPFVPTGHVDTWSRALIADPRLLEQWKALQCGAVLPDYLALPCAPDIWSVDQDDTGAILGRLGPQDGFSALPQLALRMLEQAYVSSARPPRALYLLQDLPEVEAWARTHELPCTRKIGDLNSLKLSEPKTLAYGELSCDLRQDPQAARARLGGTLLPWRWPLLAGSLAALLFAAVQIVQTRQMQTETDAINVQIRQEVTQAFPTLGPVLDIRVQVARALAQQRASVSTESAMNPVELGRSVAHVAHANGVEPELLSYLDGEGISLRVRLPDFAATEHLSDALQQSGLQAVLVDSRASTDALGVSAEYRIQAKDTLE